MLGRADFLSAVNDREHHCNPDGLSGLVYKRPVMRNQDLRIGFFGGVLVLGFSMIAFAGPPVPVLSDSHPGIQMLFSGDPNTTEEGCSQNGPRAGSGGEDGKLHNDLLECDNWDFGTKNWGQASFLQGFFVLGESPYSDDGGWKCSGNEGPGGQNPCINSTVRVVPTFKDTPAPGPGLLDGAPMDVHKDWVLRFDFKVETVPGDTFGGDKFFEAAGLTTGGNILTITGASEDGIWPRSRGSFVNGDPNRYKIRYGPAPEGSDGPAQEYFIPEQLNQGTVTLHYKASNQRLDFWLDNTLLLEDFESYDGNYDIKSVQLGGGITSFENVLYDNIVMGVLSETETCGLQGPGISASGDFNCDGVVDVADLGIVGANFNNIDVTYIDGDANLDNMIDVADLGIVGANWTASQATAIIVALVPEPATLLLFTMSMLVAGCRRCRGLLIPRLNS